MRSVVVAVLLGTGRIDFKLVTSRKECPWGSGFLRRMSSLGPLSPQKECPREQLGDALREKLFWMYIVCLSSGISDKVTHVLILV